MHRRGALLRADERRDQVFAGLERVEHGGADEARRAGEEHLDPNACHGKDQTERERPLSSVGD